MSDLEKAIKGDKEAFSRVIIQHIKKQCIKLQW